MNQLNNQYTDRLSRSSRRVRQVDDTSFLYKYILKSPQERYEQSSRKIKNPITWNSFIHDCILVAFAVTIIAIPSYQIHIKNEQDRKMHQSVEKVDKDAIIYLTLD